eukprot:m.3846 g.3846  ORF g.3846 m.3846 type:complete len:161 (-) comp6560_c0_seq1:3-485(-)
MNKQMGGADFAAQQRAVFLPPSMVAKDPALRQSQWQPSGTAKLAEALKAAKTSPGFRAPSARQTTSKDVNIDPSLLQPDDTEAMPKAVDFQAVKPAASDASRSRLPKPTAKATFTTPPQKGPPSAMATPADHHRKLRTSNNPGNSDKPTFNVHTDYSLVN